MTLEMLVTTMIQLAHGISEIEDSVTGGEHEVGSKPYH